MKQNFVIGTGRCGSTLLSRLLAEHPQALVLSEFFGGLDMLNRFAPGDMSGEDFARMLSRDMELSHFWKTRSKMIKEILIDHAAFAERWNGHVPVLLEVALPALTDDPEPMFHDMIAWARTRPTQPLSRHYPELFDWFVARFGRQFWIERSGGSFEFLDGLQRTFPDARFVHIHRDGLEAALSMLEHVHFREIVSYHFDPPSVDEIRRTALYLDPPENDSYSRRVDGPQDVRRYADYWSFSIARGYAVMPKIRPKNLLELRFEDLLADPRRVLQTVAAFFEMPDDPDWIDRALGHIKSDVPIRVDQLSAEDQQKLSDGCYYGQLLLGRDTRPSPVLEANRVAREVFDAQLEAV